MRNWKFFREGRAGAKLQVWGPRKTIEGTSMARVVNPILAIVAVVLAVGGCARNPELTGSSGTQVAYQDWSCDELSREVARTDAAFTKGQKNAIEHEMARRNCIHPLAAETE